MHASYALSLYAQLRDPATNIGKSLTQMKSLFPELRYIKTDGKGEEYEDGYPKDGIATFFYFKSNKVVEECMIVQSDDGFAYDWYKQMVSAFNEYPWGFGTDSPYVHRHVYSTFTLHLIYTSEYGKHTAFIVYENGGYNTGVTGADFFKKYGKHK